MRLQQHLLSAQTLCHQKSKTFMHSEKVTVATTATVIVPADDKPRTIYIHNAGGAKIYVGGSSVTTTTGFHIGNGESQELFVPTNEKLYAVVASSTNDIQVLTPDLD